jgi:hypothetical protein
VLSPWWGISIALSRVYTLNSPLALAVPALSLLVFACAGVGRSDRETESIQERALLPILPLLFLYCRLVLSSVVCIARVDGPN